MWFWIQGCQETKSEKRSQDGANIAEISTFAIERPTVSQTCTVKQRHQKVHLAQDTGFYIIAATFPMNVLFTDPVFQRF